MGPELITVRNSAELSAAVERLAAGEGGTIRLEAGRYALDLRDPSGQQTDAPIRLTSADPDDPALLSKLTLHGRENLTIDNLVFDSSGTAVSAHHRDLEITASEDIVIRDSVFRGGATEALDGTPGQVQGVDLALVRASEGIEFHGNHMSGYYQGVAFKDSSDIVFAGNEITRFQGDGIRIAGVQDLLIEGNHLHGMLGTSQDINHSDMIQFWGTNISQNTERVTIRDNVINTEGGPAYQMIFGRNEHFADNGWLFEGIVIEGNLLFGAHHNTISIAETDGMVVRHNTVLWNSDTRVLLPGGEQGASVNGWVRAPGSGNAVIENNIATNVAGAPGANGVVTYDDVTDPSHFSHHFVNLDAGASAGLRDLSLRPDSAWDGVMGAPMTWSSHGVDGLTAVASVGRVVGDRSRVLLDARFTRDEGGRLGAGDASFTWVFADGTRRSGMAVEHDFLTPGVHSYVLEVRTPDGRTDRIERKVTVADPDLLTIDMSGGRLRDLSSYGTTVTAYDGAVEDGGFRLDGTSRIELARYADQLYSLDSFALSLTLAPEVGTSGTLVELKNALEARIAADGRLVLDLTTTDGAFRVSTAAGAISGTAPHEIGFVMDGAAGELRLLIDGEVMGSAFVSGRTLPLEHWGYVIGNQFGGTSVRGVVSDIRMRGEPALEPERTAASQEAPEPGPAPVAASGPPLDDDALLVRLGFDGEVRDASGRGTHVSWDEDAVRFDEGSDGTGGSVALGDRDDGVTLSRSNEHLFGREAFHVVLDLRRGDLEEGGSILTLHQTMDLSIDAAGRLAFELATDGGEAVARSAAPVLTDGDWHRVEVAYDGSRGWLELVVDDAVVGRAALTGATAPASHWGLALGRLWGGEADGWIDELRIYDEAHLRDPRAAVSPEAEHGLVAADVAGSQDSDPGAGSDAASVLAAFAFDGDLLEAAGRRVALWAEREVEFVAGRDGGRAAAIGEGASLQITRENAFLHERDSFAFAFDLRKDTAAEDGRVLHFHKALEARVEDDEFVFSLRTDEGAFRVSTTGDALDDADWHRVEIGYDDDAGRLALSVDGRTVSTEASGTTAPGLHWGLTLGAAWGDALDGAIDDFEMSAAPDWDLAI